jgi:hypothetical protein
MSTMHGTVRVKKEVMRKVQLRMLQLQLLSKCLEPPMNYRSDSQTYRYMGLRNNAIQKKGCEVAAKY